MVDLLNISRLWFCKFRSSRATCTIGIIRKLFVPTVFAYFKVFKIIREHRSQVQANQNATGIEKYKKSISTILYILAVFFILSYLPYVCCLLALSIAKKFGTKLSAAALNASTSVVYSSSFVNPLLYYWRINEIRDSVRSIVLQRKLGEFVTIWRLNSGWGMMTIRF